MSPFKNQREAMRDFHPYAVGEDGLFRQLIRSSYQC